MLKPATDSEKDYTDAAINAHREIIKGSMAGWFISGGVILVIILGVCYMMGCFRSNGDKDAGDYSKSDEDEE